MKLIFIESWPFFVVPAWLAVAPGLHATQPLAGEDTATLGRAYGQIEAGVEEDRVSDGLDQPPARVGVVTFTGGLAPTVDASVSLPVAHLWDGASPHADGGPGLGDPLLAVKWRFFESGAWALAAKPSLELPLGGADAPQSGTVPVWGATVVAGVASGAVAVNADLFWQRQGLGPEFRGETWGGGLTVVAGMGHGLALAAESGWQLARDADEASQGIFGTGAVIWSVNGFFDLDAGLRYTAEGTVLTQSALLGCTLHH